MEEVSECVCVCFYPPLKLHQAHKFQSRGRRNKFRLQLLTASVPESSFRTTTATATATASSGDTLCRMKLGNVRHCGNCHCGFGLLPVTVDATCYRCCLGIGFCLDCCFSSGFYISFFFFSVVDATQKVLKVSTWWLFWLWQSQRSTSLAESVQGIASTSCGGKTNVRRLRDNFLASERRQDFFQFSLQETLPFKGSNFTTNVSL